MAKVLSFSTLKESSGSAINRNFMAIANF